ncbi:MAG: outer membrane protein assembly factor BamD [Gemmatimonadetes bacterium]|nr:outer membrane protein assembly factor BamD [Gemmatimonadota bacterium]
MTRRPFLPLLLVVTACHAFHTEVKNPEPVLRVDAAPEEVDRQWAKAQRLFRAGKWTDAATQFERLNLEFASGDARVVRSHFFLGECYFATKSHLQAVREFRRVSDENPSDALAPDALLRAGDAFSDLWRRPELDPTYAQTAIGTYQEVMNRFPGTHAAALAQVRINDLNDKLALKQYGAALFYIRYKADDSAILYLKDLASTYPRAKVVPEALVTLISIYQRLGYTEDIKETCTYLRRFHPQAPGVATACTATSPAGTS